MKHIMALSAVAIIGSLSMAPSYAGDGEITIIHTGDFHGHLVPRPNMRSDGNGLMEGGLARVQRQIKKIRDDEEDSTLYIHTGDTIQGSAEVLYTRGQAIVDVLNHFKIDAFAPGNWEFVYGTERFLELFAGPNPKAPWGAIAANVYYSTLAEDATTPYPSKAGQRVLPPYLIKQVGNVKVGIMGFTTDRGPQVVGSKVTKGFKFTKGDAEVRELLPILRNVEQVDLVIMASELGLANNIRLAEANPGIDIILSSDMHEETHRAVVTSTGTVIIEEGQDGTMMGELEVEVVGGRMVSHEWTPHNINSNMKEDVPTRKRIAQIRKSFVTGPDFQQHVNPFNRSVLQRPIDSVVGFTAVALHRSNFSHENMPAVIEGTSHDFLADAFKSVAGAQVGAIRGFRYGTHVAPGPITMEDLYHFVPIGPQIAVGTIKGQAIKNQIEGAADGSLNPNVAAWTGGWLFNFSGVSMNINPYGTLGTRASNIMVNGAALVTTSNYTYASYWYPGDPCLINVVPVPGCIATGGVPSNIRILKDAAGNPMDATEVVVKYLQSLPGNLANPVQNRISVFPALPAATFGNSEVQPWRGARP